MAGDERLDGRLDGHSAGRPIEFANPRQTLPVSVTGTTCGLSCAHCGGYYLRGMSSLDDAKHRAAAGRLKSVLVSGGCDGRGAVPLAGHADELRRLKGMGVRLNLHVGLIDEAGAAAVAGLADTVSFDYVGDAAVAREVYGVQVEAGAYERAYAALRRHAPRVVPHLCLGLLGGGESGEERALEQLAAAGAPALVFLVLIPTPGTRYAGVAPPHLERVAGLFALARGLFPATPLMLGCMRPTGAYRRELDMLAVRAGLDGIVLPARAAQDEARRLGRPVRWREECCALP